MSDIKLARIKNAEPLSLDSLPILNTREFQDAVIASVAKGARLAALFGLPARIGKAVSASMDIVTIIAVLIRGDKGVTEVAGTEVKDSYPALTGHIVQAHLFEREIAEQWGVRPEGHPWLKPIRFHKGCRPGKDVWARPENEEISPGVTDFFRVEGEEVHEVAVGPVHAGVIEPGHFRFQCHGERVFHLEISLGYQHRGVENALINGPDKRSIHYIETLAGDTTAGHALAYCQAVEALCGHKISARAEEIRAIALELERCANHTGDLGALAGDVGFLPTASYCGALRGDFLNMTALICGNRFGRNLIRPGGVIFDLDGIKTDELMARLEKTFAGVKGAAGLLWETQSVIARFEDTGRLSKKMCRHLGLVGVAARACGVPLDIRSELPAGAYTKNRPAVCTFKTGDVYARAYIRWLEIERSFHFIKDRVENLAKDGAKTGMPVNPARNNSLVVSCVEGWRGEICHVAITGDDGRFVRYKVVDPSFHNWMGLQMALRNQQISDFPLCNKSFNLSYCGHDL